MCHPKGRHRPHVIADCDCCCEPGIGILVRRFMSSNEEQEKLEMYKEQLEKELEGVKEHIQKLKKK